MGDKSEKFAMLVFDGEFSALFDEAKEMNKKNGTNISPQLIQVGARIVDINGNIIDTFSEHVIRFTEEELKPCLSDWSAKTHKDSGLLSKVYSGEGHTYEEVEKKLCEFLKENGYEKKANQRESNLFLTGNSIENDQRMLQLYMPEVLKCMHYQIINISSIKVLVLNKEPRMKSVIKKAKRHTCMSDVDESICELMVYMDALDNGLKSFNLTE